MTRKAAEPYLELYRTDFRSFVDLAFRELHSGSKLAPNFHIDLGADRLQSVERGKIDRLELSAPPRSLKSEMSSVALPAYAFGRNPKLNILLVVGHSGLANELMAKILTLLRSDRYRAIFPHMQLHHAGMSIRTRFSGTLRIVVVGHQISGHGADLIIVDDPLSPFHAQEPRARAATNEWFDAEVMQRMNNYGRGKLVLAMQRVHTDDLSGHLSRRGNGLETVLLPSIAIKDEEWTLSDGRRFYRKRGTPLDASRMDVEEQLQMFREKPYVFATQFLQDTCGSTDEPFRFRWQPKTPDWKPGMPLRSGFFRIGYRSRIWHQAFGRPLPKYANWLTASPLTSEEREESVRIQQEALIRSVSQDDEGRKFLG